MNTQDKSIEELENEYWEDWEHNRADLEYFRAIIGENLPLIQSSTEIPIKLLQKYKINLF